MIFPRVPLTLEKVLRDYLRSLSVMLEKELINKTGQNVPVPEVLLTSPSKKVYAVRVDDSGVVSATLVQE